MIDAPRPPGLDEGLLPAGSIAPEASLPVLGAGGDRAVVGRPGAGPAIAVFFKESCPTCRMALPLAERLHRQVRGAGARVIGVSQDAAPAAVALRDALGLTMPILVDAPALAVSDAWGLVSVPTFYLVDADGRILDRNAGFHRETFSEMARRVAAGAGAPAPRLWSEDEEVPPWRPG